MEARVIKNIKLTHSSELKMNRNDIELSIELLNIQETRTFVPVWDGRGTDIVDNLFMFVTNVRLYDDGWVVGDISVTYAMLSFMKLTDDYDDKLFRSNDGIKYIPIIKDNIIKGWNIKNKFTSIEMFRDSLVSDIVKKDVLVFMSCYVKVGGEDFKPREILLKMLSDLDKIESQKEDSIMDVKDISYDGQDVIKYVNLKQ